jgi:hypothetical protein
MTTIGEAVDRLGMKPGPGSELIIARIGPEGRISHRPLREVKDREIESMSDVYVASGSFTTGSVTEFRGRSRENVKEILVLPFDCDLTDFIGMSREQVIALPQVEIEDYIRFLVQEVEQRFEQVGVPIHGIDYTGHGILARVRLEGVGRDRVADIQAAHKFLIKRVNKAAGIQLVDPQASDAGTRIMRLVPCLNGKGPEPRPTRTLVERAGAVYVTDLLRHAAATESRPATAPPPQITPEHARRLSDADARAIVEAVRPHWEAGRRHAIALALSGLLAKAGVPEEQAAQIVEAIAGGDEESRDRVTAVATSYSRVRAGADVRGWFALREWMPESAAAFVDARLDHLRASQGGRIVLRAGAPGPGPKPEVRADASFWATEPPADAFFGWVGEYHRLVEPTTEAADAFHLGAALTLIGSMVGRRVRTVYASEPLYANVYTVLIGPSGSSRKDTAIKRALAITQLELSSGVSHAPVFSISRDVSSAEGLVADLRQAPHKLLYLTELSATLMNARRKSTATILDKLIEAWDTPHVLQNLNKMSPQIATNPYLSIIAATQPGRFASLITDEDIHSGFANRWLYMPGVGKSPRATPPALDEPRAWELYLSLKRTVGNYAEGTVLRIAPECEERWSGWYAAQAAEMGTSEEEDAMRIRHATLIHKLALIYAISEGAQTISLRHIEPAIALVDWMWGNVRRLMADWGVTPGAQLENRIIDVLERRGPMRRRDLQRACSNRKWTGSDFAKALDSMLKNGTVAVSAEGFVGFPLDIDELGEGA